MTLGTNAGKRLKQATRDLMSYLQNTGAGLGHPGEEPVVYAVTKNYPTRVVLYAAAFQGGWTIRFMKSLGEALAAAEHEKPRAVFYDHAIRDSEWDRYCASFSQAGVPFVLLAHKDDDETFLVLLAAGGYHAWGNPLTSENVVNAMSFAGEISKLAAAPALRA